MSRFRVVLLVVLTILLPACSSLTNREQAQLDKFDKQIASLKTKLATLKGKLATKVEDLTTAINAQYTNLDKDILIRINTTKTKRSETTKKCNKEYQKRTQQYKKQLKKKTENLMNSQYSAQYQSALASRNGAVNPLKSELDTIRKALEAPMSKFYTFIIH